MKTKRAVAWFLRAPISGRVKTRLNDTLGRHGALRLHRAMVSATGRKLSHWEGGRCRAWVAGWRGHPSTAWLTWGLPVSAQRGADLGVRMHHALQVELRESEAAVVIGSDCPGLTSEILDEGFTALEQGADIALGPALDGGYYLVGLRRPAPRLFQGVPWGTSVVLRRTLIAARRLNLTVHMLPAMADIDRPEDVRGCAGRLFGAAGPTWLHSQYDDAAAG